MFAYLVRVDKVGAFTRNRTEVWRRMRVFACAALTITGIICGSFWWERGFATLKYSTIRKDGCFRIDDYRPFWILPDFSTFTPMMMESKRLWAGMNPYSLEWLTRTRVRFLGNTDLY